MYHEGMNWSDNNEMKAQEELTALVIGQAFLNQMKNHGVMQDILAAVDSHAMRILEEIVRTLDDETLDDPECIQKIGECRLTGRLAKRTRHSSRRI